MEWLVSRNVGNFVHRSGHKFPAVRIWISSSKTKNKMGERRPEEHSTDPKKTRMQERSRKRKRMEPHFERGQGPEGAVAPHVEGWSDMEKQP